MKKIIISLLMAAVTAAALTGCKEAGDIALRAGVTYQAAKTLTEHVDTMAPGLREHYLQGNRDVLLLVAVLDRKSVV